VVQGTPLSLLLTALFAGAALAAAPTGFPGVPFTSAQKDDLTVLTLQLVPRSLSRTGEEAYA
jgi:hypothetical protein